MRLFTDSEIADLRSLRLWDVIVNSTSVSPNEIQKNVFFWMKSDPCPQPAQLQATDMPKCEYLKGYDHFQVNFFLFFYTK